MLTVEGFEVPIMPGTQLNDTQHGDYARAFSGRMRSDIRSSHRVGRIVGSYFDTSDDAVALRAILATPGPLLLGGTMIGDDAYFHVRNVEWAPITVDRVQISFDVAETDATPSPLLFSLHGDAPGTYTFTRPSRGRYVDSDGVLKQAGSHRARFDWGDDDADRVFDTPSLLLETPAFTNLVSSDNFDSGWTSDGTPVITASISDPAGGTAAYRIADDSAGALEQKYLTVTFTGNTVKAFVFVVRQATMASSGNQQLQLYDATAVTPRFQLNISAWSNGVPTVTASTGTYLGKRYVGNGYWALYGQSTSVTAANTNRIYIGPAETVAATGSIDVYRVNAYNAASPPWSILDASETKAAETMSLSFPHRPQAMCGHVRFRELDVANFADQRIMHIGAANDGAPRLFVYKLGGSDAYTILHDNGVSSAVTVTVDISPSWGDLIDLWWWLYADGSVKIAARKNGGSITTGSASSALALPSAWSGSLIHFGSVGSVGGGALLAESAIVVRGSSYDTAALLDIARARLNPRIDTTAVAPLSVSRSVNAAASISTRVTINVT